MKSLSYFLASCFSFAALSEVASAANPFLNAPDDQPVAAAFKGTEWGEEIQAEEIPLRAKVTTTRIAQAAWGGVYKIEFQELVSKAPQRREIRPAYFVVTDDVIALLNEENPEKEAKKLAELPQPPKPDPEMIYGLAKGSRRDKQTLTEQKVTVKGDICTYQWSHNSGHFTTVIWKRGVGLQEYAQGQGAHADGYRLTRVVAPARPAKAK